MKYRINVHQEVEAGGLESTLRQAAQATLETDQVESGSLTLVLTDQRAIQRLNKEFAGMDRPTDVLAFPGAEPDPDDEGVYYGDVIIALPIARQQATQAGHSTEEECALLTVHGTLHLLGYDHDTPAAKDEMWSKQSLILTRLGLSSIEPRV